MGNKNVKEVKAALEEIGYKVKVGIDKNRIKEPNYSGIIGKSTSKIARRSIGRETRTCRLR